MTFSKLFSITYRNYSRKSHNRDICLGRAVLENYNKLKNRKSSKYFIGNRHNDLIRN